MAKLNQLDVSVVLKIKQMQNLEPDHKMIEKWSQVKEEEVEKRQNEMI